MKYYSLYISSFICLLLFIVIISWGNHLIKEGFDTTSYSLYQDTNTPLTSHNVDMPINTTYSCKNFCGPKSQCSITREQCTSDVDCYGCQPIITEPPKYLTKDVRGQNDAGKLGYNQTPQYSELTTDIGTQAALYNKPYVKVPQMYLGVDRWMKSANIGMQLFQDAQHSTYQIDPTKYKNTVNYPPHETATGLFIDNGPLPANAYL